MFHYCDGPNLLDCGHIRRLSCVIAGVLFRAFRKSAKSLGSNGTLGLSRGAKDAE